MSKLTITLGALLAAGCGDDGAAPIDAAAGLPIDEGHYVGNITGVRNNQCGMAEGGLVAGEVDVTHTSATQLRWANPDHDATITCSLVEGQVSCPGYDFDALIDASTTIEVAYAAFALTVRSRTSVDVTQVVTLSCTGAGCAAFAAQNQTTFPCTVTADSRYEQ